VDEVDRIHLEEFGPRGDAGQGGLGGVEIGEGDVALLLVGREIRDDTEAGDGFVGPVPIEYQVFNDNTVAVLLEERTAVAGKLTEDEGGALAVEGEVVEVVDANGGGLR
jgi:hypothetical protein